VAQGTRSALRESFELGQGDLMVQEVEQGLELKRGSDLGQEDGEDGMALERVAEVQQRV